MTTRKPTVTEPAPLRVVVESASADPRAREKLLEAVVELIDRSMAKEAAAKAGR